MIRTCIENANFEDTGFSYTLSLISGKHKMVILYCLMEFQVVRFNELKRYLKTISQDPQHQPEGAGSGQADRSDRVSPDPAEGGIQPEPAGKVPDGGAGSALRLGHGEPAGVTAFRAPF